MSLATDTLLRAVQSFGTAGGTTKQIADYPTVKRPIKQVASRLNKLYGKVERDIVRRTTVPRRFYLWRAT